MIKTENSKILKFQEFFLNKAFESIGKIINLINSFYGKLFYFCLLLIFTIF